MKREPLLSPGRCRFYPGKKGYYLEGDYTFQSHGGGVHTIPAGFWFNGASIPALFWQLTFSPFDPDIMPHALAHDWAYSSHVVDRWTADETLWRGLRKDGYAIKAKVVGAAVKTAGSMFWDDDDIDVAYMYDLRLQISESDRSLAKYGL